MTTPSKRTPRDPHQRRQQGIRIRFAAYAMPGTALAEIVGCLTSRVLADARRERYAGTRMQAATVATLVLLEHLKD